MPSATQKKRLLRLDTPLGDDVLLIQRIAGKEGLGQLFSFDLELLSEKKHDIDLNGIVGQNVTVRLQLEAGGERFFNGVVSSFVQTAVGRAASDEIYSSYRATVVPWLWLLTRTANCRIFQEKTVPDILMDIFGEYGFSGFVDNKLTGSYPTWEYCVQYRETAFNFVSRLMEQEGIYYYFSHEDGKHMLVLCDSAGAHQPFPGYATIPFRPTRENAASTGSLHDWAIGKTLQPVKFAHTDYNFKKPRTPMLEDPFSWPHSDIQRPYQHADLEVFDYPGEFVLGPEGDQYAKMRIEELQAYHEVGSGNGDTRGIAPGSTFTLKNNLRGDQNRAYLVVAASYSGSVAEYATGKTGGDDEFACSFSAVPADTPFRAPRNTPKPTIQGAQTAIVVGPSGEEIFTDEFGRVKVQFHWDREHHYDATSSCWIRVAQTWAGKKWGAVFTPRVGQEVVVSFLEGDPDQPLIVGSVYNQDQAQHYKQPDHKTRSSIKSNSTKGGTGHNEVRFEDLKGKEQLYLHAQRNMDVRVTSNSMESVGGDRHLTVGGEKDGVKTGDQKEMVYRDKQLKVHRDQIEHIGGDVTLLIGGVDGGVGNQDVHLKGTRKELIDGDAHLHIKGSESSQIDGDRSLTVGGSDQTKVGMKQAVEAGQEIHLKAGMNVVIEAGLQLTIKCGSSFVDISPKGVTIVGTLVMINSGGAAGSGSGSSPQAPEDAKDADPQVPTRADDSQTGQKSL